MVVLAGGHVLLTFGLALVWPLWLLLLAPLLLGVPHVLADLRYLVLRAPGGLGRRAITLLAVLLGTMTAMRALALAGAGLHVRFELALGFAALLGVAGSAEGPVRRRRTVFLFLAALAITSLAHPRSTVLLLGHGHNLVALAFLVLASRGRPGANAVLGAVGLALLGAGLILSGTLDPLVPLAGEAAGLTFASLARTLAPDLAPRLAARVVLTFAFLQAMHYSIWVHLLPSLLADGPTLDEDLGTGASFLPGLAVLAAVGLPLWGWVDPIGARSSYLSLVAFHGWLELAVLAQLGVSGRTLR